MSKLVMIEVEPGFGYFTEKCPTCGVLLAPEHLADVTTFGMMRPDYVQLSCPTPWCGRVCKVCHREPGDVHGPDCGPLMFGKLERPHIVDQSDCR